MKIALGADHAGFQLKESLKRFLDSKNLSYTDFGVFKMDEDDYPQYAYKVCNSILQDQYDRGILICGTGIGMCITCDIELAQLSRLHNDANVLCLGGRTTKEALAMDIVDIWLNTSFEGGRHHRRVELIKKLTGL